MVQISHFLGQRLDEIWHITGVGSEVEAGLGQVVPPPEIDEVLRATNEDSMQSTLRSSGHSTVNDGRRQEEHDVDNEEEDEEEKDNKFVDYQFDNREWSVNDLEIGKHRVSLESRSKSPNSVDDYHYNHHQAIDDKENASEIEHQELIIPENQGLTSAIVEVHDKDVIVRSSNVTLDLRNSSRIPLPVPHSPSSSPPSRHQSPLAAAIAEQIEMTEKEHTDTVR